MLPLVLVSALLVALSAYSIQAQSTTADAITDGCLTIQSDWPVCAGLKGFQLDTQVQGSFLGLAFARANASDTRPLSAVFASNFRNFLDLQTPRMPNNVNLTYIQTFKERYGCPNYTHHHRRYLISMWCIDSVYASSRCPANSARRPLCRETCNTYAESSIESFSNSTQCPPQAATQARANGATEIRNFCDREMFNGREPNCISGRDIEPPTCGYLLSSRFCDPTTCPEATKFCAERFGISSSATTTATTNTNGSAAPGSTDATTGAQNQNGSGDSSSPAPIVPIILGSALALLVLLVGAMYFWRWRVDKRRRERYMEGFSNRPTPGGASSSVSTNNKPSWIQDDNPPPLPTMAQVGPGGYANLPPQSPSPYQQQQQQQEQQTTQLGGQNGQPQDSQQYGAYWMVNNAGQSQQQQQQQQQQSRDAYSQPQPSPYTPNAPTSGYPMQQQQQQPYTQSNVGSNVSSTAKANKRISSMIVDKNVSLTELLRASLALDDSQQPQSATLDKNLPAIPQLPANGTAGPPVTEYERPVQHRAVRNYAPQMEDELELLVGDVIAVSQQYDDGWGFGLNLATGQVGVLPLGFVSPVDMELDVGKVQARQSIYGDPDKLREVREQAAKAAVASVPLSPIQQDHGSSAATVASSSNAGGGAPATVGAEPGSPMLVDTSRVSVSGAMQTARDTVFLGDDDDDVVYSSSQGNSNSAAKAKGEKVDIDTLMEVLWRIARTDRESRILADLNVDFNALETKDPNARQSIMSQIERERALAQSDAVSEASVDSKRFSFSALLDVLNDAAGSDDEDADVDPDTLANTLLNSYNIGVAVPPESAATTSSALGGGQTANKSAPPAGGFTPLPYPSPLGGSQQQPPTGPSPYGSHVQQDELRPMSTLSDLDRLESMLNQEEEMLRKMRS